MTTSSQEDDGLFSTSQLKILQPTSVVTGFLSILGSSYIIYNILTPSKASAASRARAPPPKTLRNSVYCRLMFGLSCLDILFSFGNVAFSSWAIPSEVDFVYNAQGSWASCEAGGFFTHFMLGATLYSAYLALYFVLIVRWGKKEDWIAKRVEPFMHASAVLFPLVTAPIAIANNYFNPLSAAPGTCWFEDYPPTCSVTDDLDCIRGDGYKPLALICGAGSMFFSLIVNASCMVLLVLKVRQTELKMKQYAGGAAGSSGLQLTKRTCIQALLYIGAYSITFAPLVALQFINLPETRENRTVYFVVGFLAKIFTPLQGALNCLVFLYRKSEPSNNRSGQSTTATTTTTRLSSTMSRTFGKSLRWSMFPSNTKGTTASTTDGNYNMASEEVSSLPVTSPGAMVSRQDSRLLDANSKNEVTEEEAEEAKAEEENEVEHHHGDGLVTNYRPAEDAEEANEGNSEAENLEEGHA